MPFYMRHMHITRGFSFILACFYNFWYSYGVAEYFYGSRKAHEDGELYSGLFMFVDLFWIYNTTFYFPVFFMNALIIGRELRFDLFEPRDKDYYGTTYDEVRLGVPEMWKFFWQVMNLFNPLWWFFHIFDRGEAEIDELGMFE